MATPNVLSVIHAHARLIINPTNFSAAYPYGGTEIGIFQGIEWRPNVQTREVAAEEWGGANANAVYAGERPLLLGVLRGYDADAIAACFPNTTTTSSQAEITGHVATGNVPGTKLSGLAMSVLVAPKEETLDPALYLPNALPVIQEELAAKYSFASELGLALSWVALPDANGRLYDQGLLANIVV